MSGAISFLSGLRFVGHGIYQGASSWVDERTRESHYRFKFGYLGGVVGFDVDENQFRTPPELEAGFKVLGKVEWRERDSSLMFRVLSFEPAVVDDSNLSDGFSAHGVVKVQHKYVGQNQQKQPVNVADLLWVGGVVKLRDIAADVFAQLPDRGDVLATFKLHTGQVWSGGESHRSQVMALHHVKPYIVGGGASSAPPHVEDMVQRKRTAV